MNANPFHIDPKQSEEFVKLLVAKMFEEMKQGFSQKILNLEKNQAQQENMLNQIFNEVRNLNNPKTT